MTIASDEVMDERCRWTRAVYAGLGAELNPGMMWGEDAMEQFEFGKKQAVKAIFAAFMNDLTK